MKKVALLSAVAALGLGAAVSQAAVREAREETGVTCEITGLVGIYTDPRHVIHYTSDDEVRQEFSIVLTGRPVGGEPTPGTESSEVRWVPEDEVGGYAMDQAMRRRVRRYLSPDTTPEIA